MPKSKSRKTEADHPLFFSVAQGVPTWESAAFCGRNSGEAGLTALQEVDDLVPIITQCRQDYEIIGNRAVSALFQASQFFNFNFSYAGKGFDCHAFVDPELTDGGTDVGNTFVYHNVST